MRRFLGAAAVTICCSIVACGGTPRDARALIASYPQRERRIEAAPAAAPGELGAPSSIGQWTLHKVTDGVHVGYTRQGIVARGPCGTWVETIFVFDKYDDRIVMKACFSRLRYAAEASFDDFQAIMIRRHARTVVVDFRNGQNPRTKHVMHQAFASLSTLAWQSSPTTERDDVVVPAGHFIGAQKIISRLWIQSSMHSATVWTHTAVPLGGVVRATGDYGYESVLLDYGSTGATDELPDFDEHLEATGL